MKLTLYILFCLLCSLNAHSQNNLNHRNDFVLLAYNDTILTNYYWKLYEYKCKEKLILLIPKSNKNILPRKFYLENQSKIEIRSTMMSVCCNELYIDNVLIVPKGARVYIVKSNKK
jgi:hypothetical protein